MSGLQVGRLHRIYHPRVHPRWEGRPRRRRRHRRVSWRCLYQCVSRGGNVPKRPDAKRSEAISNPNYRGIGGNPSVEIGKFVMGYGLFPSAFVLNFVCPHGEEPGYRCKGRSGMTRCRGYRDSTILRRRRTSAWQFCSGSSSSSRSLSSSSWELILLSNKNNNDAFALVQLNRDVVIVKGLRHFLIIPSLSYFLVTATFLAGDADVGVSCLINSLSLYLLTSGHTRLRPARPTYSPAKSMRIPTVQRRC